MRVFLEHALSELIPYDAAGTVTTEVAESETILSSKKNQKKSLFLTQSYALEKYLSQQNDYRLSANIATSSIVPLTVYLPFC